MRVHRSLLWLLLVLVAAACRSPSSSARSPGDDAIARGSAEASDVVGEWVLGEAELAVGSGFDTVALGADVAEVRLRGSTLDGAPVLEISPGIGLDPIVCTVEDTFLGELHGTAYVVSYEATTGVVFELDGSCDYERGERGEQLAVRLEGTGTYRGDEAVPVAYSLFAYR